MVLHMDFVGLYFSLLCNVRCVLLPLLVKLTCRKREPGKPFLEPRLISKDYILEAFLLSKQGQ